ncbi:MAG: hypothetical protein ACI9S8_002257, partial [Chlamydiales bacterium]
SLNSGSADASLLEKLNKSIDSSSTANILEQIMNLNCWLFL